MILVDCYLKNLKLKKIKLSEIQENIGEVVRIENIDELLSKE